MPNELAVVNDFCELSKTSLKFKRDVTKSEWAKVFSGLKTIEGCVQFWIGDCLNYREHKWGKTYAEVSEETGYNEQTLKDIKWVSEKVSCRQDKLSFEHHKQVASLDPEKQEKYLKIAVDKKLSVRELRDVIKTDNHKLLPKVELPKGKYNVIYADPPWQFSNSGFDESAESHYPTMSTEEICAMPIPSMKTNDSVLFLWATNAMLKDAIAVCEAWGFEYKSNISWIKSKGPSIGWFVISRHELLLICTAKNNKHPNKKYVSWVEGEVTKHSKKPECFYGMIEKMYEGPYLEMFARNERKGWVSYGNQISKN